MLLQVLKEVGVVGNSNPMTRRDSMSGVDDIAMAKSAFASAIKQLATGAEDWRLDGGYWAKVREQFVMPEGFAYMNTGRLGSTPRPVLDLLTCYWRLMAENPSENSSIFENRQEEIRVKAAQFVGASPDEIALVRNTTEGLVTVINGLDLKQGDEVLYSFHEHASNLQPWKLKAQRHGIELKEVPVPTPPKDPNDILNLFEDAITPRTRVITTAHSTTVTGTIMPIKELASLCRSRNILCLIDGAHALGQFEYDLHDLGIDTHASTCHKWLCSPAGIGLLYVREELIDRIWPNIVTQRWYLDKGARKYDRLSRRPWPQVAILEDAIDFHVAIGKARIERRTRGLGSYLREKAREIAGVTVYTGTDPRLSCGVTTLGIQGVDGQEIQKYLRERYDVYVSPRTRGPSYPADPAGFNGVRVSTAYYNTFEQVDRVLQGLGEIAEGKTMRS